MRRRRFDARSFGVGALEGAPQRPRQMASADASALTGAAVARVRSAGYACFQTQQRLRSPPARVGMFAAEQTWTDGSSTLPESRT